MSLSTSESDSDSGFDSDSGDGRVRNTVVRVTEFPQQQEEQSQQISEGPTATATGNSGGSFSESGSESSSGSDSDSESDSDDNAVGGQGSSKIVSESKLFSPYRTVGLVTNEVPFQLNTMGKDNFLTTCIGRSWQVMRADSLTVRMVSRRLRGGDQIKALAVKRTLTWGAVGRDIVVWKRGRRIRRVRDAHERGIDLLYLFGEQLLSLSFADRTMKSWRTTTSEKLGEMTFDADFTPSCILHPHTYLDKVLVGSREGHLEIWNTRTQKKVFRSSPRMFGGVAITCLEQSPALDVIGCGLADGRTVLYNAKFDEELCVFRDSDAARDGGITCLAFHPGLAHKVATKNGKAKAPSLVTGSANGKLSVWDLGSRQLLSSTPGAHDGLVSTLAFIPGQPLLVTAGADNAVRQWIFDQGDGSPRLLRHRAGHKYPPRNIRYVYVDRSIDR